MSEWPGQAAGDHPAAGTSTPPGGYGLPGQPGEWAGGQDSGGWPGPAGSYPPPRPGHARGAGRSHYPRRRRGLLLAAGVAVVLAAGAVVAVRALHPAASATPAQAAGHHLAPAAASVPPAITMAAARQVLSRYLVANNAANQSRSAAQLAAIEGGSSYRLDAGAYRFTRVSDPANSNYQPVTYTAAAFYIPRLAGYPRWFVTAGTWAATGGPHPGPTHRAYLVFAQAAAGARWLEVLEPNITGAMPAIATGPGGYATAIPAADAGGLAVRPSALPARTARQLDGGRHAVTGLGRTQDQKDRRFWHARLPLGAIDSDQHAPASGGVYALRTKSGGALVFYSLSATLTLAPRLLPGQTYTLQIPGYYSSATPLTRAATVPYADQFAVSGPAHSQPQRPSEVGRLSGIAA